MDRNRPSPLLLLLMALTMLIAACGTSATASGPPDINYGRDVCFECGMIISEARFASAYRTAADAEMLFDDIGGMLKYGHATGEIATAEAWVHDYETEEWVAAEQAYFIVTQSVATPMAFGILAFGVLSYIRARVCCDCANCFSFVYLHCRCAGQESGPSEAG